MTALAAGPPPGGHGSADVLWYGKVDKIGADASSLPRSLFVTVPSLLVCLAAGGVTRTISLAKVREVRLEAAGPRPARAVPSCTSSIVVDGEPTLVVGFASPSDQDQFVAALLRAAERTVGRRDSVRVVRGGAGDPTGSVAHRSREVTFAVPEAAARDPATPFRPAAAAEDGIRILEPITRSGARNLSSGGTSPTPSTTSAAVAPRGSGGVGVRSPHAPPTSVSEMLRRAALLEPPASSSAGPAAAAAPGGMSPLRDLQLPGAANRALRYDDVTTTTTTTPPRPASQAPGSTSPLRLAPGATAEHLYQRLAHDVVRKDQQVEALQQQVVQQKSLLEDLQSALRAQEGAFQEMVKANEELRLAEQARSAALQRAEALEAQVRQLESERAELVAAHRASLAAKTAELEAAHRREVEGVQDAFAAYDAQMTEYVESLQAAFADQRRAWRVRERLYQRQIAAHRAEVAALNHYIAPRPGRRAGPSPPPARRHHDAYNESPPWRSRGMNDEASDSRDHDTEEEVVEVEDDGQVGWSSHSRAPTATAPHAGAVGRDGAASSVVTEPPWSFAGRSRRPGPAATTGPTRPPPRDVSERRPAPVRPERRSATPSGRSASEASAVTERGTRPPPPPPSRPGRHPARPPRDRSLLL